MVDMLHESNRSDKRKGVDFGWRQFNLEPPSSC
jgi:hypothetical protein